MENNILYFNNLNVLDSDNNSYCIDMLRLKCNISDDVFEKYIGSRLFVYKDFINDWTSTKIADFYKNYQYEDNSCSFWFGFKSNRELSVEHKNRTEKFNLTVEFNPNKVKDNKLLLGILKCSSVWNIIRVDFAFDIKNNINNVVGFDKGQKHCLKIFDNGRR